MRKLPKYILVLARMHYKKYENASDTLTEYLEGLPHLKKRCYGEYINTTFYILPNTAYFHNLLGKLTNSRIGSVLGYRVYERMLGNSDVVYLKYPFASSYNSLSMPSSIHIPTKDIDNFIDITTVISYV